MADGQERVSVRAELIPAFMPASLYFITNARSLNNTFATNRRSVVEFIRAARPNSFLTHGPNRYASRWTQIQKNALMIVRRSAEEFLAELEDALRHFRGESSGAVIRRVEPMRRLRKVGFTAGQRLHCRGDGCEQSLGNVADALRCANPAR